MIQAIAMVLDFAPPHWSSGTRMVAICVADYANSDTGWAWPSVRNVARRTGLSERQVQRHLRIIEADGWIRQGWTRQGESTASRTTLWIWERRVRLDDSRGDTHVTPGVTPASPHARGARVTPVSPNPLVLNHQLKR
jgi:DNA-binding transcriptional ArsR family regulator